MTNERKFFTLGLGLYRVASSLIAPLIPLYLNRRVKNGKEDADRLAERLGTASIERPPGPLIWVHAASVGESLSVLPVMDSILNQYHDVSILITTGTVTSAQLIDQRKPERVIHQFVPVDLPGAVAEFLDHWQPNLGLWVESEFWPNLISQAAKRQIPLALVNARISAKSHKKWKKWPKTIECLLNCFSVVLAQNNDISDMLASLGAKDPVVAGNLKFVADPLPFDKDEFAKLDQHMTGRLRWIVASTHPGEEEMAAQAHLQLKKITQKFLTIVVPRHPERGEDVALSLEALNLKVARRALDQPIEMDTDIYVADTLGELGLFYRLCDIAFIGGSLVPHGGQNPLEAARLDCAILHGPHIHNFDTVYHDFEQADADKLVELPDDLGPCLFELLHNEKRRLDLIANAKTLSERGSEILDAYMSHLQPLLDDACEKFANASLDDVSGLTDPSKDQSHNGAGQTDDLTDGSLAEDPPLDDDLKQESRDRATA